MDALSRARYALGYYFQELEKQREYWFWPIHVRAHNALNDLDGHVKCRFDEIERTLRVRNVKSYAD